eukprot:2927556-Pleurochrysis_carterae.AAC.1
MPSAGHTFRHSCTHFVTRAHISSLVAIFRRSRMHSVTRECRSSFVCTDTGEIRCLSPSAAPSWR